MRTTAKTTAGTPSRGTRAARATTGTPMTIRTILVPTDFSAPSRKGLRYAVDLAERFGARIILLNVVEQLGATPDFAYNPLVLPNEQVEANAKKHLDKFRQDEALSDELVERTLVRSGVPYSEICSAARTLKCDLIVIATHGYTGLKHVFMGSTAERVVRHAQCPVLVVRAK